MKKGIITTALVSALFLGHTEMQAQAGLKKATKEYNQWAYTDAITIYEKVVKRGHATEEVLSKLANAYYFNARYAEAQPHYEQLINEFGSNLAPEYYYRYAQTLQNVGRDAEAKSYYKQFVDKVGSETQIGQIRKNEAALEAQIQANSGRYDQLSNLAINTPMADYGSYVHNNQLYFTSARDTGSLSKKEHTWTGEAFTSLYTANVSNNQASGVKRIKGRVKSMYNEASAVVTKDGQTMYFTRNNYNNKTRKFDSDGNTKLKIYRAENVDGKWSNVTELPFNSNEFNTSHPALSKDETMLYFSSDRAGGYGSTDLWSVTVNEKSYGSPKNLGPQINTEARETFPFVTANNELYFSSDGRVGLGGLDVYGAGILSNGMFSEVQNLGAPVNSNYDDFAYYIDTQSKNGFFSSNREGGKGNDDIYSFYENRALVLQCDQNLKVKVIDAQTRQEIKDATVSLYNVYYENPLSSNGYQNDGYRFNADFDCGSTYRIRAEKQDYFTQEANVTLPTESGETEAVVVLERSKIPLKKGDDLFKVLQLNPIYFDLDKHNIRPDAAAELAKVLAVMEEYPDMVVDIRSHTDSRASHKYNDNLSDRRAKSTREWLISKGISASRLTAKGYGERELVNKCADGVKCSEEQHQQNRRSEFIIVDM
ncbi:OmpA family protein [Flavobacterium sp. xlx-214]|uniref:OmpA family protein n=1 Tax=unclassified Flavobacterium TaxID=196869 RepID=UPI0013D41F00|nr:MULTISPECIES: OmpA family protein [unclassified Flavobacterium]MBA5793277.1 OmpA family protein [Flavobacterium sp. xlx-221]QMI84158.1 OmpA family protein [Flavobacterium sp. xlx-214]